MTRAPVVVHRPSLSGGRRVTVHRHGQDEFLGTAYSDHGPARWCSSKSPASPTPDAFLDDPQWVEWRGGPAHEYSPARLTCRTDAVPAACFASRPAVG
ncbi:hypothetical protein [Streptomyces sp. NPDC017673]|uniref:hypothetical protein n=1 Tax=Streptomyces sp. NPDC017673 TaxID=3365005 RepID=UPI00379E301F